MMKKNNIIKKIIPIILILIIAFLFTMNCSNTLWYKGADLVDSSVFKYIGRLILEGGMPYRDVFDHKGPLIYIINALGIMISTYRGIYVIEFINIFLTFFFIFKIANLKCNEFKSIIVLLITSSLLFTFFQGGNLTEEYALPFISVSLYIFLDYFFNDKITNLRLIACGLSFGTVCLLRINMISLWLIMCIAVLFFLVTSKNTEKLVRFILYFLLGCSIIVVPFMIWLILNGAFEHFIHDYFTFNFLYTKYTADIASSALKEQAFTTFLSYPLVITSIMIISYKIYKEKSRFDVFYLSYIIATIILISIAGRTYPHYGMILIPTLVYPYSYLLCELSKRKEEMISLVVIVYLLVTYSFTPYIKSIDKAYLDYSNRKNVYIDEDVLKIRDIIKSNSDKNDKILVSNYENNLYNLSNRFAASKYAFQPEELFAERFDEFLDEIEQNKPKLIILNKKYYTELMNIIDANYKLIWTNSNKTYKVYERIDS